MKTRGVLLVILAALIGGPGWVGAEDSAPKRRRAATITIVGEVLEVHRLPGEGGLEVTALTVQEDGPNPVRHRILLAPPRALEEIGFVVSEGDRIRARVFKAEQSVARVQKIRVINRGTMVRLRSLRELPLWSGDGSWNGGACRATPGTGGSSGHGGRGGSGRGGGGGR